MLDLTAEWACEGCQVLGCRALDSHGKRGPGSPSLTPTTPQLTLLMEQAANRTPSSPNLKTLSPNPPTLSPNLKTPSLNFKPQTPSPGRQGPPPPLPKRCIRVSDGRQGGPEQRGSRRQEGWVTEVLVLARDSEGFSRAGALEIMVWGFPGSRVGLAVEMEGLGPRTNLI